MREQEGPLIKAISEIMKNEGGGGGGAVEGREEESPFR